MKSEKNRERITTKQRILDAIRKSKKIREKITKQNILDTVNAVRKSEKTKVSFLLSHSLIWYIIFLIVPLGITFVISLWQMEDVNLIPNWTLENYVEFITEGVFNAPWLGVLLGFAASLIVITIIFYSADRTVFRKKQVMLARARAYHSHVLSRLSVHLFHCFRKALSMCRRSQFLYAHMLRVATRVAKLPQTFFERIWTFFHARALNDAFVISFLGALMGTIFTLILPRFGFSVILSLVVGVILSLMFWLLLIRRYYETKWLGAFAVATLATSVYAAISFISASPLIPSSVPLYAGVLIKSIFVSVAVTLGSVGVGYPIAYYLSMKVEKYKYTLLFLLMGPYLASYILLVFAWKVILDYGTAEGGGVINAVLLNLGLIKEPITWLMYNIGPVVFILIFSWGPWLVFPMFANLEKMDKTLLEAAADLGANPRQAFWKVTLPLSKPGILVAILFVFIPTIGEFVTPSIVGGTEGMMYANIIEGRFKRGYNWPLGSALSFILLITTLIMASILIRKVSLEQVMESL
ncbi:MAG: ABC transporter permease [Candidatus Bathyarchaeota archaeon]|nr:MAG: ABC transporter permease [Candidatus Bathyarchaeota archaeon]